MYINIYIYIYVYGARQVVLGLLVAQSRHLKRAHLGVYKIFFYFEPFVHESTIFSFPAPTCIAHTVAILLQYDCAIFDPTPNPVFMPHTIQYCAWQYRVKAKPVYAG